MSAKGFCLHHFLIPLLAISGFPLLSMRAADPARNSLSPQLATGSAIWQSSRNTHGAVPGIAAPVFTGPPVSMQVTNWTGRGVDLVRLNADGTQQACGMVPPTVPGGRPASIDTRGGHLWLFKSEGRVLRFFAATNEPVQDVQLGPLDGAGGDNSAASARIEEGWVTRPEVPNPTIVLPPVPTPIPKYLKGVPSNAQEFLRIHNDERARLGIPPLLWSKKLARYAQKWAEHLARSGDFEHRSRSEVRYGENLFRGDERYSPGDAARRWMEERSLYRGGPIPRKDLTLVGHYTQMVWRETTHVGFGMARGRDGLVVVANYDPGGNRTGEIPFEIDSDDER